LRAPPGTSQREASKGRDADRDPHQRLKAAGMQSQRAEALIDGCVIDATSAMAVQMGMDLMARNQRMGRQEKLLRLHLNQCLVWHRPLVDFKATRRLRVIGHHQWINGAAHCITFHLNGCPCLLTMATTCDRRPTPIILHMLVIHL